MRAQTRKGTNSVSKKNIKTGCPVEMVQQLGALTLAEDPDSNPSIHMAVPVPRDAKPFSDLSRHHGMLYTYTHAGQISQNKT